MQRENSESRMRLFAEMMNKVGLAGELMNEYESIPHKFKDKQLYQVESHTIQIIGQTQGITVTELSALVNRTPSACSQMVRKLRRKNWVEQIRNQANNREYNLYLTKEGWSVYKAHEKFDEICYSRNCSNLDEFSDDDLLLFLRIMDNINRFFEKDVERSKETDGDISQFL